MENSILGLVEQLVNSIFAALNAFFTHLGLDVTLSPIDITS
jgi:hypothetical protein